MAPLPNYTNYRCPILLRTAQQSRGRALAFVAAQESVVGTKRTNRASPMISVVRGRLEVAGRRSRRRYRKSPRVRLSAVLTAVVARTGFSGITIGGLRSA